MTTPSASTAPAEQHIKRLEASVHSLIETVQGLPEELLYRAPNPGEWPVMSTLAHVVELMPYWSRQARAVAARERNGEPFGRTHDDPDRIGAVEQHGRDSLASALERIRGALGETVRTLRDIPAEGWSRTGRHANRGEMSVEAMIDQFLVSHVEEHLGQAREAIRAAQSGQVP